MKRVLVLAALLMCLCAAACAERTVYADQGGVRVYAEDGRYGLMAADDRVLYAAEYDAILPFDGDFAIARRDGKQGVIRRDGVLAVPCAWDYMSVYPDRRMAVGTNDGTNRERKLFDLDTGAVLMDGGGEALFYADDRYIYRLEFGYDDPWELEGPFKLTVYDGGLESVCAMDGVGKATPVGDGFVTCTEAVGWKPGGYSVADGSGAALLTGLTDYDIAGEDVWYVRWAENPIRLALEAAGYDRRRVRNGLMWYLGVDGDMAELLTGFMADRYACGVLRADGSRMETGGCEIMPGDGSGPICVNARRVDKYGQMRYITLPNGERSEALYNRLAGKYDRYGYIDESGAYVVPPVYEAAWPFVDGAAIVKEGDAYHLIDAAGDRLGEAEWWGITSWMDYAWKNLYAFPVLTQDGCRMVNRRGEYVGDQLFADEDFVYTHGALVEYMNGYPPVLTGEDGGYCVFDAEGNILLRVEAEDWNRRDAGEGVIWLKVDGLWGLMNLAGDAAGAWRVEPRYITVYARGDGYTATLKDLDAERYTDMYITLYLDADGRVLGSEGGDENINRILAAVARGDYDELED